MPLFCMYVAGVGEKKQTGSGQSEVEGAAFLERNASQKNQLLRRFTPGSVVRARRFNCLVDRHRYMFPMLHNFKGIGDHICSGSSQWRAS
ncbi:hypothetical protein RHMOL_Rhmol01G0121700 [Rhododendron molle]|uniref:Uncharacterized protein n=1 Tax=Rhododendron molle TaxID=49168 RepID=A0ACC0Q0C0_RHOML|nr:hypothetical protein RHMOL_Rhmol01G0121700 [Rhododendron molle]